MNYKEEKKKYTPEIILVLILFLMCSLFSAFSENKISEFLTKEASNNQVITVMNAEITTGR